MIHSTAKQSRQLDGRVTWNGSHSKHTGIRLKGVKSQSSQKSTDHISKEQVSLLKQISSRISRISATKRGSSTAVLVQPCALLKRISNRWLGCTRDSPHVRNLRVVICVRNHRSYIFQNAAAVACAVTQLRCRLNVALVTKAQPSVPNTHEWSSFERSYKTKTTVPV
jgi:hypothetical protein